MSTLPGISLDMLDLGDAELAALAEQAALYEMSLESYLGQIVADAAKEVLETQA